MHYRSVTHATKNENGLEQIEIELARSFWQRLTGRTAIVIFERWPTGWRNKATGEYATVDQRFMIANAVKQALTCR